MTVLTKEELYALCEWSKLDSSKNLVNEDVINQLYLSGSLRNVIIKADSFGPRIIALLYTRGFLDIDEDPVVALGNILDRLELLNVGD